MCAHSVRDRLAVDADEYPTRERVELPEQFCCWREWAFHDAPENEPRPGS